MTFDISQLVRDLIAFGYTETALAEKIGCGQSTIHYYKTGERGQNLRAKNYLAIVNLHKKMSNRKLA